MYSLCFVMHRVNVFLTLLRCIVATLDDYNMWVRCKCFWWLCDTWNNSSSGYCLYVYILPPLLTLIPIIEMWFLRPGIFIYSLGTNGHYVPGFSWVHILYVICVYYRVTQNKIPHQTICNIFATSGQILKILEAV